MYTLKTLHNSVNIPNAKQKNPDKIPMSTKLRGLVQHQFIRGLPINLK
jgi:hypothetical protein